MKKALLLILLFLFQFSYGQDSIIALNEVTVNKSAEKDIKNIIKKIKKNLKRNYESNTKEFSVKQIAILDKSDTLININRIYSFDIKSLDNNFSIKLVENKDNQFYRNKAFFDTYEEHSDSPEHWISESLIRKNLDIERFDFFNTLSDYQFLIKTEGHLITVQFTSDEYYSGYFIYDKNNYNLHHISFSNSKPYPFTASLSANGKNKVFKKWNYNTEEVTIQFTENNQNQIAIKSIICTVEIDDYYFEKYNKKGAIIKKEGPLQFYSFLKIEAITAE